MRVGLTTMRRQREDLEITPPFFAGSCKKVFGGDG